MSPGKKAYLEPQTVKSRFLLVSDTHNLIPKESHSEDVVFRTPFPSANVFIHAGDMTNHGSMKELKGVIDWVERIPAEIKILIAGNHDLQLDADYWVMKDANDWAEGDYDYGYEKERREQSMLCKGFLKSEDMKRRGIWYLENEVKEFKLTNGAIFTVHLQREFLREKLANL